MKRRSILSAAIVLLIIAGYFYYGSKAPSPVPAPAKNISTDKKDKPQRNTYYFDVKYDGLNTLKAKMKLIFKNNSHDTIDELYLHLYPNIFKTTQSVPFPQADLPLVFPRGYNTGEIDIKKASQEGQEMEFFLVEDDLMLQLPLLERIAPGEYSELEISFSLTVPYANFRFGYQEFGQNNITVSLGNWYPALAVYEDGKWCLDGPQAVGDWTYSELSDYEVKFSVPKDFTVAASGKLEDTRYGNGKNIYHFKSDKLRDFAAAISNNYEIASDMFSGIKIFSYYHPQDKKGGFMALNIAKRALETYSEIFGDYPYPELRIVEANYYCGGMEFPTFIIMNSGKYHPTELYNTSFERSLAHEIAHQWFYSVVGNNQVKEPWIDEGITEFCTLHYFEQRYGQAGREAYYDRYVKNNLPVIKQSNRSMLDPLPKFTSRWDYFPVIYTNGVLFYEEIRSRLGEDKFMELLKAYFDRFKYENVSFERFYNFLREQDHPELDESFYTSWFQDRS